MSSLARLHAMAYADNATRLYQLDKYRRKYPTLFVHAVLETTPKGDYYVPEELSSEPYPAIERLRWDEEGCRLVSCFPFRSHEEPCESGVDSTRWVKVDNLLHVPACQPACERGFSLDTRYDPASRRCRVVNSAKKLFLMYPEKYNGKVAKKVRLSYDRNRDALYIDKMYCMVYGVNYDEEKRDCELSDGQLVFEALLGSTFFRKTLSKPYIRAYEREYYADGKGEPPDDSLLDRATLEEAWEPVPRLSERIENPPHHPRRSPDEALDELDVERHRKRASASEIAIDLARDVGADLGLQVTANLAKRRLAQSLSKRLARKISLDAGMKHAFLHGVSKTVASRSAAAAVAKSSAAAAAAARGGLIALKSSVSFAATAFTGVGLFHLALDLADPYEFGKRMDREQVEAIDRALDLKYFETDDFENVDVGPEDAWNTLRSEEEWEEDMEYYAERFREYLDALKRFPQQQLPPQPTFPKPSPSSIDRRGLEVVGWVLLWVLGCLVFFVRVDFVAFSMLCYLLLWNALLR